MSDRGAAVAAEILVLLTGVSGYIGGRLLHAMEGTGYRLRCRARRPMSCSRESSPQPKWSLVERLPIMCALFPVH